jgi:hypothetical protein
MICMTFTQAERNGKSSEIAADAKAVGGKSTDTGVVLLA